MGSQRGNSGRVQLFPGFRRRVLPLLAAYWIACGALSAAYSTGLPLVVAAWLTPTTVMLWPVGRRFGLWYNDYRTPWFLASVLSMAGVPVAVGLLMSAPYGDGGYWVRYAALITLIACAVGLCGVFSSHRKNFGKPMRAFFRPDLIMGVNRTLAGGLASMAIGMKFIFSDAPPGDLPHGNWYAFLLVIVIGLYQLIPLRGLVKMRLTISRMVWGKGGGYGVSALKELYLLAALTGMLFAAHNFFGGVTPFTRNVLAGSTGGILTMLASGSTLVLLRAWYKRRIGDPFFVEKLRQSVTKDGILAGLLTVYLYGYVNVMVGGFPRVPNAGHTFYLTVIGLSLYAWGLTLLIPLRAWARRNQLHGVIPQMLHTILPSLEDEVRVRALAKVLNGVAGLQWNKAVEVVKIVARSLGELPQGEREKVVDSQLLALASLTAEKRAFVMKAMDAATRG